MKIQINKQKYLEMFAYFFSQQDGGTLQWHSHQLVRIPGDRVGSEIKANEHLQTTYTLVAVALT